MKRTASSFKAFPVDVQALGFGPNCSLLMCSFVVQDVCKVWLVVELCTRPTTSQSQARQLLAGLECVMPEQ